VTRAGCARQRRLLARRLPAPNRPETLRRSQTAASAP
jgi:hypothetical protein